MPIDSPTDSPADPADAPSGPQANPFGGECACTCEELEKIDNLGESVEAMGEDGMPDPALISMMMCPMMCMALYGSCEVE